MEKMYLVIFMITCTVYRGIVNGCPSSCSCTNTDVSCEERSLTTVPLNIPTSTTKLYLRSNNITRIDANSFQGLLALTYLSLSSNNIARIDANSFQGLSALTHLDLCWNNIARIDANSFQGLSALTQLSLSRNNIARIDANSFQGLSALTHLFKMYHFHGEIKDKDMLMYVNEFNQITSSQQKFVDGVFLNRMMTR